MKAILQEAYGAPADVLRLADVDKPSVANDAVLVRVQAAALNAGDWRVVRASPFVIRLGGGFRRPRETAFGLDAAGIVEEVGKDVTHVQRGDEVFGVGKGSCAEYVSGRYFVHKPSNLSFEEAAAVPVAAITALKAIRDKGKVQGRQSVAINGAGGGVGTFTVQIARAYGAEVTAVTNTGNIELVRSLGADHVIDYTREDFTARGARYDHIIDNGGTPSLKACLGALTPGGKLILVGAGAGAGGPIGRLLAGVLRALVLRQPIVAFISKESNEDLLILKDIIEAGKIKPVIDRTYALADTSDAVGYLETGTARGKVVIAM